MCFVRCVVSCFPIHNCFCFLLFTVFIPSVQLIIISLLYNPGCVLSYLLSYRFWKPWQHTVYCLLLATYVFSTFVPASSYSLCDLLLMAFICLHKYRRSNSFAQSLSQGWFLTVAGGFLSCRKCHKTAYISGSPNTIAQTTLPFHQCRSI